MCLNCFSHRGLITWSNGDHYDGQFLNGQFHGYVCASYIALLCNIYEVLCNTMYEVQMMHMKRIQ